MATTSAHSNSRWVCCKCGLAASNLDYLDMCFQEEDTSLVRDGEEGEYWLGCSDCNHSFHVMCFLKEFNQDTWAEAVQNLQDEINDRLEAIPTDANGQRIVTDLVAMCMPPYQCKPW